MCQYYHIQGQPRLKDRTVRSKFVLTAKYILELQYCNTWETQVDCNEKPKLQHFVFTHHEMVPKPHCSKNSRIKRPDGAASIFLCPEDYTLNDLGQRLIDVGKAMIRQIGKGYQSTTDPAKYHDLVFGKKIKK